MLVYNRGVVGRHSIFHTTILDFALVRISISSSVRSDQVFHVLEAGAYRLLY